MEKAGMVLQTDRNTIISSASRLIGRHCPERIPPQGNRLYPARKCKVCIDRGKCENEKVRKETVFICRECNIPLCLPDYFTIFSRII